ncbi:MAG: CRISPR-associated endonuclease Cas3'', partial [Bacteroidales bacterium]|nr:CRISPR-associated endonuclease Cas3'' [Bacteroidales bacterium]
MDKVFIAHIKSDPTNGFAIQDLNTHLERVGVLMAEFSNEFFNAEWGKVIGKWHDIGKYSEAFQQYIIVNSGCKEGSLLGKTDHSSAGAIFAKEMLSEGFWQPIAYCIAGHHAGLHNWYPEIGLSG